jgi:hypothetical protein
VSRRVKEYIARISSKRENNKIFKDSSPFSQKFKNGSG